MDIALVGAGGQGTNDARNAANWGDVRLVCDVDRKRAATAIEKLTVEGRKPEDCADFRRILDRDDIDVVYITGYGFPVHRGGPMLYADQFGLFNVVQAMQRFARNPHDDAKFWQPAPLLARLVAEGQTFNNIK